MQTIAAMPRPMRAVILIVFVMATAVSCRIGIAADASAASRAERTHAAAGQPARTQGAVSFAVEQTTNSDIAPRVRVMHGDPSLLMPELRAGRVGTPGGRLALPQGDPRLKPLGW